jgi:exopolysaccharide biosynthesis polyprenyl glycosylphosphotransferase
MNSFSADTSQLFIEGSTEIGTTSTMAHSVTIRNRFEKVLTAIEVIADWLTVVLAVNGGYVAYHYLHLGRRVHYAASTLAYASFAVGALFVILLDRDGAYRPGNSLLRIKETERAMRVSAQALLLILPITFFAGYQFSRWVFVIAMLCVPFLQVVEKQAIFLAVRAMRSRGFGMQRVLIYGAGSSGRRVFSALIRSPKLGLNPIALVDDDPEMQGQEIFEYAYRRGDSVQVQSGPITQELLEQLQCEMLVIAIPSLGREKFSAVVNAAHSAQVRLAYVPGQSIAEEYWTEHADIDGIMLSVFGLPANKWQYDFAKRLFDLFTALALIVFLAPVWIVIAALVRLDSPGPVIFKQLRVGKGGKLFSLYKFRSMRVDAPKYGFSPTQAADPRITRVGRFLRRTSLDELAQLLNVLKGDMSLVGPRPEMPFIVEQYNPVHRQRLHVTPGITGLWQLSADRAFLIHENIQYDLYYIRHRSFFMDFAILLHTVVFAMHGV